MPHQVTMPQMGYDMTEGTINTWNVKEGDRVARGDAIATIATDKADIDIEAYADGVLRRIVAQPGQTVAVGAVIAWIGEPDESIPEDGSSSGDGGTAAGSGPDEPAQPAAEAQPAEAPSPPEAGPEADAGGEPQPQAGAEPTRDENRAAGADASAQTDQPPAGGEPTSPDAEASGADRDRADAAGNAADAGTESPASDLDRDGATGPGEPRVRGRDTGRSGEPAGETRSPAAAEGAPTAANMAALAERGAGHGDANGEAGGAAAARGTGEGPVSEGRQRVSPYARRRAADLGVDLASVRGTGPQGRVVAADVEREAASPSRSPGAAPSPDAPSDRQAAPPRPDADGAAKQPGMRPEQPPAQPGRGDDPHDDVQPSRLRRALARAMSESNANVPHFHLTVDVDAAPLLRLREECNALGPGTPRLSLTDLIVRACALTLQRHPHLNASWADNAIRQYRHSNIAVAVALADGLMAPTLRRCETMSMSGLAEALHDLVARAKSNRLREEEMWGGHMAVSNLGMFDVDEFSAIITPPHSSVLAVGAVRDVPVVVDGEVVPGKRMRLTLGIDHRVTDGAEGAEALAHIRWLLEHPAALLL